MSLFLKHVFGDQKFVTSEVFAVHVSRTTSLNEVSEYGCLSHANEPWEVARSAPMGAP